MSRKDRNFKRDVLPDPKYKDLVLAKAINAIMMHGKKSIAEKAFYNAFDLIKKKSETDDVLAYFHKAVENVKPVAEVRSRRVGGATYQVPTEVRPVRAQALALRWIKTAANSRNEKTVAERLAAELMDAFEGRGSAIKKREDTHKMAEANKAFAHFRW